MTRGAVRGIVATVSIAFLTAAPVSAGDNCQLGSQAYPPNVTVCSGGLSVTCINGNWQNNNGQRCDAPSGTYLGPRRPFEERNHEQVPEYYRKKYPSLRLQ